MPTPPRHHHILRIDNDSTRTHCWRVQVQRQSRIVFQHFSDTLHGGKRKALQAAVAYRDTLLEQMHDMRYVLWRRNKKRRNNTSGTVGIGRYPSSKAQDGKGMARASWHAFWDDADGQRRTRKFAVNKYGETRAKALARAARRDALQALADAGLAG